MPTHQRPPNILYIMSDDHAANAIGCYGSRLAPLDPTPNIDRLASQGMRLDEAHCTNGICTPSRASIITGQHSHTNGVRTLADPLDPTRLHLGHLLQDAGYQTALVGKWHLHTEPTGFDEWQYFSGSGQQGEYFDPLLSTSTHGQVQASGYASDVVTERSLDWLRRRDRDRPFLLMCHHKAPHSEWEFPERHRDRFDGDIPEPANLFEDKSHRSVGSRELGSTLSPGNPHGSLAERFASEEWVTGALDITGLDDQAVTRLAYRKYLRDYLRCAASVDDSVGALMGFLEDEGLTDDTVVIYTSDQGMFLGEHDYYDKRWMFQEALQMPFIIRYPREIEPGTSRGDIVTNVDFAPTMLDYAGVRTPAWMQGRSFRANLRGDPPADWPTAMYYRYWMHMAHHGVPAHYGIKTARYKLIFFYGLPLDASDSDYPATPAGWELYDLQADPGENHNVYEDPRYDDVVVRLHRELAALKRHYGDNDERYPQLLERLGDIPISPA